MHLHNTFTCLAGGWGITDMGWLYFSLARVTMFLLLLSVWQLGLTPCCCYSTAFMPLPLSEACQTRPSHVLILLVSDRWKPNNVINQSKRDTTFQPPPLLPMFNISASLSFFFIEKRILPITGYPKIKKKKHPSIFGVASISNELCPLLNTVVCVVSLRKIKLI